MTTKAERDHNDLKVLSIGLSIYVMLSLAIPTVLHVMDRYKDEHNGAEIHLHFDGSTCTGVTSDDLNIYRPDHP